MLQVIRDKVLPIFIALSSIIGVANVQAQKTIKGYVFNEEGKPVEGANVIINNKQFFDITNSRGFFKIEGLQKDNYRLIIKHLSYQSYLTQINVSADNSIIFRFTIHPKTYHASPLIVTATRTLRQIEEVPLPVTVISEKQIERTGSTRLSDILQEQTGLILIANHGTGVQMQGLAADYTKIMVNGQPLIGRTAGTLNLNRISIGNVKRIEIVKGPSSALWGSDALAGVINIITKKGQAPFDLELSTRYAENNTWDLGLNLSANINGWANHIFINRNSSQGYRLVPGSISQTVPAYQNYTISYRTSVPITDAIEFKFNGRFYRSTQSRKSYLGSRQNPTLLGIDALKEIYSLAPTFTFDFSKTLHAEISHYFSRFRTDTKFRYKQSQNLYDHSAFDQYYNKTEVQVNKTWNKEHITTVGAGYIREHLQAKRYSGIPTFNSYFIFAQHQWMPSEKWDIIAGFRYDAHSEYSSQLSPKLSVLYKLTDWLHLHTSAGSGFKAPAFRQLYLNFTNPTVGYSVFGSNNVKERIRALQKRGIMEQILIPLDQLKEIKAEHSWAFNTGINLYPTDNLELEINAFYNDVNNLIETAPIARKKNGQAIYSYFNLNEVYTTGFEFQLTWYPVEQIKISAGYQLLKAKKKIINEKTVLNESGQVITKKVSSYKPLFNRSNHTANFKIYYTLEKYDIRANMRGLWRSKYGRIDANGNGYVNTGEYADGYMIWDAAVAKTFSNDYTLRLGVDNLFNFTRPAGLPYLPGRIFYVQASIHF